jgi:hypothetical protein
MINILDHYWIIGGSTTDVYSSATNTMVPVGDATYVAWTASNAASPIASEAELVPVVQAYGSRLPAWLFTATDTFIQPTPTTYTHGQLAAYSASERYNRASGGVTISSISAVPFLSDPVSRNTIDSANSYAVANPGHVTDWKMSDGSFIQLSAAQIAKVLQDVATFVQSCFTCEGTTLASINGGTITDLGTIAAAYAAISNVFP